VLLNLLANARDAVDERHADTLDADRCVRVRTGCHSGDRSTAVLEVEDNGPGMDASQAERIFEPFFTTKGAERGTGLGLSISNAIVINHGGRIECESVPGAGSTFRVFLPTVREA
jgi:signal transduction histidine kinase